MEPIGKSPVALPLLVAGKLALFFCWIFPLAGRLGIPAAAETGPFAATTGIALYAAGTALAGFAFASLGKSLAVGLPESATELKTGGVYRFSRNPIYLAAYFLCAGSCVMTPHPVNLLLFLSATVVHHRIILREERFLGERFGGAYAAYRRRVRRYLGIHQTVKP
jgi:protein-S-isoprenylcysteine O-methyltransferase Ste14